MMSGIEDDDNVLVRVMNNILLGDGDDDDDDMLNDNDSDDNDFIRIVTGTKISDDEKEKSDDDEKEKNDDGDDKNIRVVAAIDFGTTYSGFAYAYKSQPEIYVHDKWQGCTNYKTPTILKYEKDEHDGSFKVKSWGYSALANPPKRKNKEQTCDVKLAERFKLKLRPNKKEDKIYLPEGLNYKKAITDYLTKIRTVMEDTLEKTRKIVFSKVLIIMTVPAEFDNRSVTIMRECAFDAGLIKEKNSSHLKFTTEPEAAAINCMSLLKDLDVSVDKTFTLVDCGGGTVDLTTRRLLKDNKLGETVKSRGRDCGGSYVDENFIEFLASKVGQPTIDFIRNNHCGRLQYAVQEFCRRVKHPFTGQEVDFVQFDFDLEGYFPNIKEYVDESKRDEIEEEEWSIELKFDDVKKMFDPEIEKIIELISKHLDENNNEVSAMLFVGGFCESKYLQEVVSQKFKERLQDKIFFPERPVTAIVEGAVKYGLNREVIATRRLKWTYGTDVARKWKPGDSEDRRLLGSDQVIEFSRLVECDKVISINKIIPRIFTPGCIFQRRMGLDLYITEEHDADFCDSPGVRLLGKWSINLPITLTPRPVLFLLIFGEIEVSAIAINLGTGRRHKARFELLEP